MTSIYSNCQSEQMISSNGEYTKPIEIFWINTFGHLMVEKCSVQTCPRKVLVSWAACIQDLSAIFSVTVGGTKDGKWRAVIHIELSQIVERPVRFFNWPCLSISCRTYSFRKPPNWIYMMERIEKEKKNSTAEYTITRWNVRSRHVETQERDHIMRI